MKKMIACVFIAATACGQTLDSFKATYETEVQKIRDTYTVRLGTLLDAYGRSLGQAIDVLKKAGDPDPVLKAFAEKQRFERERTVPNPPTNNVPGLIRELQAKYLSVVKEAEVEKYKAFIELTKRYIAALDRLMKDFTAQDNLYFALNVKSEKQQAELVLENVEDKLGVVSPVQATNVTVETKTSRVPVSPKMLGAPSFAEHHYKVFAENVSWEDAKKKCETMGGHLVTVSSAGENQFLISLVGSRGRWWLGGIRDAQGRWSWVDNTPWGYTAWCPAIPSRGWNARPSGSAGHDYVILAFSGLWFNILVNDSNDGYICEWDF